MVLKLKQMTQKAYASLSAAGADEKTPQLAQIDELGKELSSVLDLDELEGHIYLSLLRTGEVLFLMPLQALWEYIILDLKK